MKQNDVNHQMEEFLPPPPDEFLQDIRAIRKQEEIEGPYDGYTIMTTPERVVPASGGQVTSSTSTTTSSQLTSTINNVVNQQNVVNHCHKQLESVNQHNLLTSRISRQLNFDDDEHHVDDHRSHHNKKLMKKTDVTPQQPLKGDPTRSSSSSSGGKKVYRRSPVPNLHHPHHFSEDEDDDDDDDSTSANHNHSNTPTDESDEGASAGSDSSKDSIDQESSSSQGSSSSTNPNQTNRNHVNLRNHHIISKNPSHPNHQFNHYPPEHHPSNHHLPLHQVNQTSSYVNPRQTPTQPVILNLTSSNLPLINQSNQMNPRNSITSASSLCNAASGMMIQQHPNRPIPPPYHHSSHNHFNFNFHHRNSLSYNGNGSLNSSVTEENSSVASSSWSPSESPLPSPLLPPPSPTSSINSTSLLNLNLNSQKVNRVNARKGIVIALTGLTQPALVSSSATTTTAVPKIINPVKPNQVHHHNPRPTHPMQPPVNPHQMVQQRNQPAAGHHHPIQKDLPSSVAPCNQPNLNRPPSIVSNHGHVAPTVTAPVIQKKHQSDHQSQLKKSSAPQKKRVSFSDQVEIVAPKEETVEDYLPNPVLERVLGKAFLNQKGIEN